MAHGAVKNWSSQRKYREAIKKVLDEEWTVSETARHYGISRSHLSVRCKEERQERQEAEEQAAEKQAGEVTVRKSADRDVGTFPEFVNRYFGSWVCPDCDVHHELPDFHHEISDLIESGSRRIVVNLPPYHSKSTLITVWHTVYEIARNPDHRTIIVSKSAPFARTFLRAIKEILSNPDLYHNSEGNLIEDWGPFEPESGGWAENEIYVQNRTRADPNPTVFVMGVGTQIYGRRADTIKFDDIATLDNQRNPDRVEGMLEWINKEALSRIGKSGKAIWVGTRVAPGDIYSVLINRPQYKVIRYPALKDDEHQEVLWPEHFPYEQVLIHRSEMSPADFQLVYQNVDIPGLNASFTQEMLDEAKDTSRQFGHYMPKWRLIAGLDPAGGNEGSGYSAMVLLAVDTETGMRFVVDAIAEKSMKAPRMKEIMYDWTDRYPIYEWRVESNGIQSQLVQYNEEIIRHLAKRGVRVVPHHTHSNKWDPEFGVESIASQFHMNLVSIPWAGKQTAQKMQGLVEEFVSFPMGVTSDLVMAYWFAELGVRDILHRSHMPLFNERLRKRWPARVRKKAKIVNFQDREVRGVGLEDQRSGMLSRGQAGYRRMMAGQPVPHHQVEETDPEKPDQPSNIDPSIWEPD